MKPENRPITILEREQVKECVRVFYQTMRDHKISRVIACVAIQLMQAEFRKHGVSAIVSLTDREENHGGEAQEKSEPN